MGHAAHLLRRLDRVSDAQVELALTLYRDERLLAEVLRGASLPDGIDRVAISLDDPLEGPFVVVTREGRFVTCLGAGMRSKYAEANHFGARRHQRTVETKTGRNHPCPCGSGKKCKRCCERSD